MAFIYSTTDFLFLPLVFIIALISHFLLDSIAIMTYHPPQRQQTKFWLYWHVLVYTSGIFMIIAFLLINSLFIVGIVGANLPDLWDWVLLRGILKSKNKRLYVHKYANKIRSLFINHVPDLSYNAWGVIPEFILIMIVCSSLIITFSTA